jgi:Trk-type K+ transport system membrane component
MGIPVKELLIFASIGFTILLQVGIRIFDRHEILEFFKFAAVSLSVSFLYLVGAVCILFSFFYQETSLAANLSNWGFYLITISSCAAFSIFVLLVFLLYKARKELKTESIP